jgi:hypothetical protein
MLKQKIAILTIIIIIMSIETWGEMPKSQIDNEKPEEMVARLISAHESSPEAHLGIGESIDVHRTNEIIDHPAGSVLADKISRAEIVWQSNFGEHALWEKNNVHDYDWPGMMLHEENYRGTTAYIDANFNGIMGGRLPDVWDYYFKTLMAVEPITSTYVVKFGFGVYHNTIRDGFGFAGVAGQCSVYYKIGANQNVANIEAFDDGGYHVFRAEFVESEQIVHFYIDGVEVASLAKPAGTPNDNPWWGVSEFIGATGDGGVAIYNLLLTRFP